MYFFFFNIFILCLAALVFSHVRFFAALDCSPPGSPLCGVFQTRILEWVDISSSRGLPQPRN